MASLRMPGRNPSLPRPRPSNYLKQPGIFSSPLTAAVVLSPKVPARRFGSPRNAAQDQRRVRGGASEPGPDASPGDRRGASSGRIAGSRRRRSLVMARREVARACTDERRKNSKELSLDEQYKRATEELRSEERKQVVLGEQLESLMRTLKVKEEQGMLMAALEAVESGGGNIPEEPNVMLPPEPGGAHDGWYSPGDGQ